MKMFEFLLKFHWSLFLKVQLNNLVSVQVMPGAKQATSLYLSQRWPISMTRIYVASTRYIKQDTAYIQ